VVEDDQHLLIQTHSNMGLPNYF